MEVQRVAFITPSRNTLPYLKLAYESIRNNCTRKDHHIMFYDDASVDDTWKWLLEIKEKDENVSIVRNTASERVGHTISYDVLIENTPDDIDWIMIFHADMYCSKNFDEQIFKLVSDNKTVVSATRIEPPLHPEGPEKIISNFGSMPEDFDKDLFIGYTNILQKKQQPSTRGIFAPWIINKKEFLDLGGHDPMFRPQSREDSDIFNRLFLGGFDLVQSWEAFVYHFTSRGSRFQKDSKIVLDGSNSEEWQHTNRKGVRNFIRKWGSSISHDQMMLPIIQPNYEVDMNVEVSTQFKKFEENIIWTILIEMEPWFTRVNFDTTNVDDSIKRQIEQIVDRYIKTEKTITDYDLNQKITINETNEEQKNILSFRTDLLTPDFATRFCVDVRNVIKMFYDGNIKNVNELTVIDEKTVIGNVFGTEFVFTIQNSELNTNQLIIYKGDKEQHRPKHETIK